MVCPSESILQFSWQEVEFGARKRQSPASSKAVRMAERSKAPDSRLDTLSLLQWHSTSVLVSTWRRGFESHSWQRAFATSYASFKCMIQKKIFYPSTSVLVAAKNKTSCRGYEQKQAMDNIIINCQKNDSKTKRFANGPAQFANITQYVRWILKIAFWTNQNYNWIEWVRFVSG